jgi:hypothetical protein
MQRRTATHHITLGLLVLAAHRQAWALSLAQLSQQDATAGLKTALERGAQAAVALLGREGGFLNNERVRIPLPGYLDDAGQMLRRIGQGQRVAELVTAMNRAAEQAVPMGRDLLINAVKTMSVSDAKQILGGGEQSVTDFFAQKTRQPLGERFLPVVTQATQKVDLARKYNKVAERAARFGLIKTQDAQLEGYVTGKTLDGLYTIIGEEERKIRQDPVGTGSAILKKVFGAL